MIFTLAPLHSSWTFSFLGSAQGMRQWRGGDMWPSSAKWLELYVEASSSSAFHSGGATPPTRVVLALPLFGHCWQFTLSCMVMLKEKGMSCCKALSYHAGQSRWSPAVILADQGANPGELPRIRLALTKASPPSTWYYPSRIPTKIAFALHLTNCAPPKDYLCDKCWGMNLQYCCCLSW